MAVLSQNPGNRFIGRFLARVPPEVAHCFSAEQLAAVQTAFGMRYVIGHALDFRRTFRFPWGRFYLVLLAGREGRRSRS